jgi:hypothetical protein
MLYILFEIGPCLSLGLEIKHLFEEFQSRKHILFDNGYHFIVYYHLK